MHNVIMHGVSTNRVQSSFHDHSLFEGIMNSQKKLWDLYIQDVKIMTWGGLLI